MSEARQAPRHVIGLAEQRATARRNRDFAAADVLRGEIEEAGWLVRDTDDGFELTPKPPFEVWPTVASLPVPAVADRPSGDRATADRPSADRPAGDRAVADRASARAAADRPPPQEAEGGAGHTPGTEEMIASQVLWDSTLAVNRMDEAITGAAETVTHPAAASSTVTVALLVDGRPADVRKCVDALLAYTDARILALDLGDVDGAGVVLHELAAAHPERIRELHVAEPPHWRGGSAGWGAARTKLLFLDESDVHVVMETATVLDGDAITPLVRALDDGAVAAGWRGANPTPDGEEWAEAGPGPVRALYGHLMAVRRTAALEAGGFPERAQYHRHADLEFCLTLPGEKVVVDEGLPVHQERHRAHDDVDPGYRERESRRTYERVLRLLRETRKAPTP